MIFSALDEAAQKGELLLVEGGLCRFHRRRDGWVSVREIIVLPSRRHDGVGRSLLNCVINRAGRVANIRGLVACCPADLPANGFWEQIGFRKAGTKMAPSGRRIIVWRLDLGSSTAPPATLASRRVR